MIVSGSASPFGRFADAGALLVALLVVVAWLASIAGLFPKDDGLTTVAIGAVGLLLGQRSTTNGAAKIGAAANLRLDAIGAPSADVAASRIAANATTNGAPTPADNGGRGPG